jgi:phosphoribosylanthranilate isomerase
MVKICGLTNPEDALAAAAAGADWLGFIFYPPGKRHVSAETVRLITADLRRLPACPRLVGVFVNASAAEMAAVLAHCSLDYAQLSGDESAEIVTDPASPLHGRAYKALRPRSIAEAVAAARCYAAPDHDPRLPSLLIDSYHPALYGGSGMTGDWELARAVTPLVPRLMLAGGLTPDNVADAIGQVAPFAVDVASGVERDPRHKDHAAITRFITTAQSLIPNP